MKKLKNWVKSTKYQPFILPIILLTALLLEGFINWLIK
jgi:hypothetical protein